MRHRSIAGRPRRKLGPVITTPPRRQPPRRQPKNFAAVGVSITADEVCVVAVDLAGAQLLSSRREFAGGPTAAAIAAVAAQAKRALMWLLDDRRQILGLSVGVAGLVDAAGAVPFGANLDWYNVAVRDMLTRALGEPDFPIVVDNSANLAMLAEHRYGPYAEKSDVVFLTGGTGLGAGIIAGGRLLRGGAGFAGEIGHLTLSPGGPLCSCGRHGCFEETAGVAALVRRLGSGSQGTELELEVEAVIRRARAQEPTVLAALHDMGRYIGIGVSVLANLLNPQVVILGGYYVSLAPWIIPVAHEVLTTAAVAPNGGGVQIVASTFGHEVAATGGAARILELVETGHIPVPSLA